jgi:hypothetical protein
MLVDAGTDSCCNFFRVKKKDDLICDTVRLYIKNKIVNTVVVGQ